MNMCLLLSNFYILYLYVIESNRLCVRPCGISLFDCERSLPNKILGIKELHFDV